LSPANPPFHNSAKTGRVVSSDPLPSTPKNWLLPSRDVFSCTRTLPRKSDSLFDVFRDKARPSPLNQRNAVWAEGDGGCVFLVVGAKFTIGACPMPRGRSQRAVRHYLGALGRASRNTASNRSRSVHAEPPRRGPGRHGFFSPTIGLRDHETITSSAWRPREQPFDLRNRPAIVPRRDERPLKIVPTGPACPFQSESSEPQ